MLARCGKAGECADGAAIAGPFGIASRTLPRPKQLAPPRPALTRIMLAQSLALGAVASIVVLLPVAWLLRRFPARGTPLGARLVAGAAYASALLVTVLAPVDMVLLYPSEGAGRAEARRRLGSAWVSAYTATSFFVVVLPLVQARCRHAASRCPAIANTHASAQAYFSSFEWTAAGRLRAAANATALFYALAVALGAVGVLILLISGRLQSPMALLDIAAAAGNLYGMCGVLVLLSYGIVDIPRTLWRSASVSSRLDSSCRGIGHHALKAESTAAELCRVVAVARAVGTLLPRRSSTTQREMVSKLLAEVSDVAEIAHVAAPLALREAVNDDAAIMDDAEQYIDDAAELSNLRSRVHNAAAAFSRSLLAYTRSVYHGLRARDDNAAAVCARAPHGAPSAARTRNCCGVRLLRRHYASSWSPHEAPSAMTEARWWWHCMLLPMLRRGAAVLLAVLSLSVILAEASTFATPGTAGDLSAFSRMLHGPMTHRAAARAMFSAAVLSYLTAASFYTVFALGVFPTFHLAPHASDAPSLLAGAALLCRFAPPLVLNFFSLVHAEQQGANNDDDAFAHTVFYEQIGRKLDAVPLLGAHAAAGFPIALLLFVALLVCNAVDRVLRACRWSTGLGDAEPDDAAEERGRELLEREEANVRAGLDYGGALAAAAAGPPAEQPVMPPPRGPVMQALHRHSLRTGTPPRWLPRPLPPLPPPATELSLLARLRQSTAAARTRVVSVFSSNQGQHANSIDDGDAAPLLDSAEASTSSGSRPSTAALLDSVFARLGRGNQIVQ